MSDRTNVRPRKDGLMVRHLAGTDRKMWWCRLCDGSKPEKWQVGSERDIDAVFGQWDQHKVSTSHRRRVGERESINRLFDALGR